jgi:nicotinamidase/pyrazinamidase
MTRLIFWDVDTLHDFMKREGKLYVAGAEEIIPVVRRLTDFAHDHRIPIVASADNHDPSDAEISEEPDWSTTFPPHCIRGTPGQSKIAETALRDPLVIEPEPQDPGALAHRILSHRGDFMLHKHTVDVFTNANTVTLLRTLEPEAVVLYGVATDFCDRHAVEGLLRHSPRSRLYLVTDAIRAIDPEEGDRLVSGWRERGVQTVESGELVRRGGLESVIHSTAGASTQPILRQNGSMVKRRHARRPNQP